jgi:hypothetical protein
LTTLRVEFKRGMENGRPFYKVRVIDPDYEEPNYGLGFLHDPYNVPTNKLVGFMKEYGLAFWLTMPMIVVESTIRDIINMSVMDESISFEVEKLVDS